MRKLRPREAGSSPKATQVLGSMGSVVRAEPGCRPFEESLALLTTLPEPGYGESSLGLELGSLGSRALGHLV